MELYLLSELSSGGSAVENDGAPSKGFAVKRSTLDAWMLAVRAEVGTKNPLIRGPFLLPFHNVPVTFQILSPTVIPCSGYFPIDSMALSPPVS